MRLGKFFAFVEIPEDPLGGHLWRNVSKNNRADSTSYGHRFIGSALGRPELCVVSEFDTVPCEVGQIEACEFRHGGYSEAQLLEFFEIMRAGIGWPCQAR